MAISVAAMKRSQFSWGVSANTVGSGLPLSSSKTYGIAVYTDDAATVATGDIKAIFGRALVLVTHTGALEIRGVDGHLRLNDTFGFSGAALATGVRGTLEFAGTHTVGSTALAGGVLALITNATALTVTASGQLGGVISRITGSGTTTGTTAGFLISNSTAKWTYGLFVPANSCSTSAINVGEFASSYATGSAFLFSSAVTRPVGVYGESTSDLTSAVLTRCGVFRHLIVTASGSIAHETYGLQGQVCIKNTTLTHLHAGLLGTFEVNTACTVPNGVGANGYISGAAILARTGGATITVGATGFLAGVNSLSTATTVSITSGGVYAAFATCKTAAGQAWGEALYIQDALVAIRFAAASDSYLHGIKASAATPAGDTTHALKVVIGTTAGYIPVYAAETF